MRLRFFASSRGGLHSRTCLELPLLSILHPSRRLHEQILFYPSPFQTLYFPHPFHLPLRLLLNLFLRLFRISTFASFLVLSLFLYHVNLRIVFVSISILSPCPPIPISLPFPSPCFLHIYILYIFISLELRPPLHPNSQQTFVPFSDVFNSPSLSLSMSNLNLQLLYVSQVPLSLVLSSNTAAYLVNLLSNRSDLPDFSISFAVFPLASSLIVCRFFSQPVISVHTLSTPFPRRSRLFLIFDVSYFLIVVHFVSVSFSTSIAFLSSFFRSSLLQILPLLHTQFSLCFSYQSYIRSLMVTSLLQFSPSFCS